MRAREEIRAAEEVNAASRNRRCWRIKSWQNKSGVAPLSGGGGGGGGGEASWLGCFPPSNPCRLSGEGRTSSKSRHRRWVSYLPAYLPAVPHVRHQRLVWRFGRLWDGDPWRVLGKRRGEEKWKDFRWDSRMGGMRREKQQVRRRREEQSDHRTPALEVHCVIRHTTNPFLPLSSWCQLSDIYPL